ncbi:MAG: sugar transferase [Elusimicrobiaceae bacterium]|nr:sugar transferase [Elusimicrobiaceae bacterium]
MTSWLFFCIDAIAFFCITWGMLNARHGGLAWHEFRDQLYVYIPIFLLATFLLWLFSFYDVKLMRKKIIAYKRIVIVWLLTLLGSASVIYFAAALPVHLPTPRRILIVILLLYFAYAYILRRNYFKLDAAKTNVLIFGSSPTITELVKLMRQSRGYRIKERETVPPSDKKYNLKQIDMVIVGSKLFRENPQAWDTITKQFIARGAFVDTDFNAFEYVSQRISRESIEDSMWVLRGIGNRHENSMYNMLKRVLDLLLAFVMLPVLLPLGCLIWVLVRYVDKCDPIFSQKRVGYFGKEFVMYKFRTITPSTQESEQETITKTGKFLRRFRLDEIPQIFNVIKGELSFVGPRPLWIGEYALLNENIPNHHIRSIAKPGLTGWAQLNFKAPPNYKTKNGNKELNEQATYDAAFTRFSYDVWYIKNHSIMLDIDILIKTGLRMFIKDSQVAN